ncbi:desmin [Melanotaenia boesemani]|uniref:desmin n=1 Tax=Melanotaenia boesemani TaxID=1250792 RepID=UPI001C048EFD|nr:desmin [Melanotaenia boesemani]
MAMLRVSSYRKLFEENSWSQTGRASVRCAGQYRTSVRNAADECGCDKLDFVAAKDLNKEGVNRYVQERATIAALNDRLVRLIELARWFEEENEYLECQITELEEQLNGKQTSNVTSTVVEPDFSLDAVVERLRKQRDAVLYDTEELKKELEHLQTEYEKAAQQRVLIQQERQDVAEEVDAVTAECLALREQVAIYGEQLANMEVQHKMEVEGLLEPDERTLGAVAIKYGSPDMTPALDVKEYYCQLAESLQFECVSSAAVTHRSNGKKLEVGGTAGTTAKDLSEIKDMGEMEMLISELQKEIAELEKCNEELEDEVEMKKTAYVDEVAELEWTIDEMRQQEVDLKAQMKEQCDDNKELLNEKMARDMEIAAYRSLLEKEDERLCSL